MAGEDDTTRVDPLDEQYAHLGLIEEPGITAYVDMIYNKDHGIQGAFASGYNALGDIYYAIRNEDEGRTTFYMPTNGGNTAVHRGMVQYDNGERFMIYHFMPYPPEPHPTVDPDYYPKQRQAHLDFEEDFELLKRSNPAIPPIDSDTEPVSIGDLEDAAKRAVNVEKQIIEDRIAQRRAERVGEPNTPEPQQEPQARPEQNKQAPVSAPLSPALSP